MTKKLLRLILGIALMCSCSVMMVACAASADKARHRLPRPDHIVIVMEENETYEQIIGNRDASYINSLAARGALLAGALVAIHPSEPNYLALFSGSTHGVTDDRCPVALSGDNLASALGHGGYTFRLYAESLPSIGYTGCRLGAYARKHNPAANWKDLNASGVSVPFDLFPIDYSKLPTVSMVVPNLLDDMHDGPIRRADRWLEQNIDSYAKWAATHNSLLIVAWDEGSGENGTPLIFVGPMVARGTRTERVSHYNLLRTITEMYGLEPLGETSGTPPITGIWAQAAP